MTAEPLKPCPFCGACNEDLYCDGHYIRCGVCNTTGPSVYPIPDGDAAITAWNRREPFGNSEEFPPEWLIRRIKNVTYGYKPAGDGFGYRDGYYEALQWVLSLKKPEKKP